MYTACIFCHTRLGENQVLEGLPTGRRIAFDPAKGRLWVVCLRCDRWNLTPIEDRWEVIQECERLFRGTKLHTSTEHVGLTRLGSGLELVRIGRPLWPEFAAWRYERQFRGRRWRTLAQTSAAFIGLATLYQVGPMLAASIGVLGANIIGFNYLGWVLRRKTEVIARLPIPGGGISYLGNRHIRGAVLLRPTTTEEWGLRIRSHLWKDGIDSRWHTAALADDFELRGNLAFNAVTQILPHINGAGASRREVKDAIELVERWTTPDEAFARAARIADRPTFNPPEQRGTLAGLPTELRLGLEMIAHDDFERRALDGELHLLERAWSEAEELASTADNLLVPRWVEDQLSEIKGRLAR